MILSAFDVQFHEKNDEIPSKARTPRTKFNKNTTKQSVEYGFKQKQAKDNNVKNMGPKKSRKTMFKIWGSKT